jgi:hypothetical protein
MCRSKVHQCGVCWRYIFRKKSSSGDRFLADLLHAVKSGVYNLIRVSSKAMVMMVVMDKVHNSSPGGWRSCRRDSPLVVARRAWEQ